MDPYVSGGLALACLAEVFVVLSTALPYWYRLSNTVVSVAANLGLFEVCVTIPNFSTDCAKYGDESVRFFPDGVVPSWLRAAQAMMILSVIAFAGGIVLVGIYALKLQDWVKMILASAALTLVGVLLAIIGTAVAGDKFSVLFSPEVRAVSPGSLHAAFGLGVVAIITGAAASILLGNGWRRRVASSEHRRLLQ